MAFKFSQKHKDIMDFIRAYGSFFTILGVVFALCFAFDIKDPFSGMSGIMVICMKILGVLILVMPLVIYHWEKIHLKYLLLRGNLKGFIIEKEELILDIQDEGRYATFFQKVYFHRYSRKSKEQFVTKINVSGTIDASSVQSINCTYSCNYENNSLQLSYINKSGNLNNLKNYFKQNDKFLFFYVVLKDTFISPEESWNLDILNLCQDYTLQILLPLGKKLKYAKFVRIEFNNFEKIVEDTQPIIVQENDRQRIVLQVMNFDKYEKFRLKWS